MKFEFGNWRLPPRFWKSVVNGPEGECWYWIGSAQPGGYGMFRWRGPDLVRRTWLAHRAMFLTVFGEIDPALTIDHLCERPDCVNPAHLEQVSLAENVRRRWQRHPVRFCRNGHEKTLDSVLVYPRGRGFTSICKLCRLSQRGRIEASQ